MLKFILLLLFAVTPPMSQAIEEPTYGVVRQIGDQIELRRYAAYVVAEVMLDTTAADAVGGFLDGLAHGGCHRN